MARRFDAVLASRYPRALALRRRASAAQGGFAPMVPPLPFAVRYLLTSAHCAHRTSRVHPGHASGPGHCRRQP